MNDQRHFCFYRRCVRKIPRDKAGLADARRSTLHTLCWVALLGAVIAVAYIIVNTIIAEGLA
jgi:hypothetical protein